jgi:hypothetical protein
MSSGERRETMMLGPFAVHLLGARQERLHPLAQLDERVARIRLLDDAGDELAHAVLVLVEHHVPLGLADALEDHLLGGLRGDAAEVLRRGVALVDLIAVLREPLGIDLRLLGLPQLAGLGVDLRLLLLLLDLREQLLLEVGRHEQLEYAEVSGRAIDLHPRVLGRAGRLLVGGQQGVLERRHQSIGGDALLSLQDLDGLDDLL